MNKSVLVVDDDEALLETLQELLEIEGYTVTLARNGVEALKTLETFSPGVIVLDLRMPRMNGEAFARELQRRDRMRKLHIIVLTANLYARQTAILIGANDFLAKPFDINELLEKIEQALPPTS